jgi:hypothetical protein
MKITNTLLGLSLCLALLPFGARASDGPSHVNYAEASLGCAGGAPDFTSTPALNIRTGKDGEVRVQGDLAKILAVDGNQIVLHTSDNQKVVIGTLTSAPSCAIYDTGEAPTSDWNEVAISPTVILNLLHTYQYTLIVTVVSTQKEYQFTW